MIQQGKRQNRDMQKAIQAIQDNTVKGSSADKADRNALESFKVEDNKDSKMDFFLLSK